MRRLLIAVVTCAAALMGLPASAEAADLPAPTSTAPLSGAPSGTGAPVLNGIRTGQHDTYDRTVFDFFGGTPGWRVEYAPLVSQGQGQTIPLAGAATLLVVFDRTAVPNVDLRAVENPNLPTLRQIKSGGYFEGYASFGLGVNDRVGFRVLVLHGPDRIAIDVAHQPTQPFTTTPFQFTGAAPDALVSALRSGSHPGYDRLVFDIVGDQRPTVDVRYSGTDPTIRVLFTGAGSPTQSPHASHDGSIPDTVTIGLPALRSVHFTVIGAGMMTADITTAARHGFRVMMLDSPTRVAVDIAY